MASPETPKAPRCPELPELPADDFWSEAQWAVFMAIMDSVIPSIVPKSSMVDRQVQVGIPDAEYSGVVTRAKDVVVELSGEKALRAFLEDRPSASPEVRAAIIRLLVRLPVAHRNGLGKIMSSLASSIGAFIFTGSCIPFHQQPGHIRESIVQGWHSAWLPTMRKISRSLVKVALICWLSSSPTFLQMTGYPAVPVNWKAGPSFDFKFLQFPSGPTSESDDDDDGDKEEDKPRKSSSQPITIETDVVIVGSGCGGGVAAKILAEAGHRVIVVDKGSYFPPSMLPMPGLNASRFLFDGNVVGSIDNSISISAASTWGGGGTVNWSVSLETQDFVRKEWASEEGLGFFDGPEYQQAMDRVCGRMGVATEPVVQTHRGRVLLEGSRKLGWRAGVCPQNSGGAEHSCGHCTMGCGSGEKMGPATCWLPDAAKAGAEFVEGFEVDRVLFDDDDDDDSNDDNNKKERKATGVIGRWISRDTHGGVGGPLEERQVKEVTIKAKRVIVACGALLSPLVLLRSGLTNPLIGRNLYLHPCYMAGAFFKEETRPWEGAIISSYNSEFENLDGKGHGVKLETTNMTPFTCFYPRPWRGGLDFKLAALRYRHMAAYISVTRDRDSGRVYPDPVTGKLLVDYTPSAFDRAHALEGILAISKILYVTGAKEIDSYIHGVEPFVRNDDDDKYDTESQSEEVIGKQDDGEDEEEEEEKKKKNNKYEFRNPRFLAWLDKVKRQASIPENVSVSSAHHMGTCRMSGAPDKGVVDAHGKVWGTQGLYVADSSVFPSASGVNPMVTVMAISDWIARAVDKDLKGEREE